MNAKKEHFLGRHDKITLSYVFAYVDKPMERIGIEMGNWEGIF